jgi:diguanylate cyclase (GGDEF)-like protein
MAELMKRLGGHSLVSKVLLMHVSWAVLVYLLSVAGLWWVSSRLIQQYLEKQAVQWVAELDAIGTPLYVSKRNARLTQLQGRLSRFPEIAYVRYYDATGSQLLGDYAADGKRALPALSETLRHQAGALAGGQRPYVFDSAAGSLDYVRLLYPVTIRALRADGLFNFDPDGKHGEKVKVIGYIDLGMDLGYYRDYVKKLLGLGGVLLVLMVGLSLTVGRFLIKRALAPLTGLQQPLARLASGDIDVTVEASGDAEIVAIGNALNATIGALKERNNALHEMANHDSLTGLVNRHFFIEQLNKELALRVVEPHSSAILFIDLDQFKYVNDTLGHAAGDRLLIQATALLKGRMRGHDVISRFGGDEFTILARNVSKNGALEIARTINDIMRNFHFIENNKTFNIYCSIGIAMIDSDQFQSEELIAQADMACHEAKRRGRNRYHMYELADQDKLRMEVDVSWSRLIKQALESDGFVLYYQPMVSLDGTGGEFFEVLLRMRGTEGQMELPGAFLPAAERFGLTLDIDHWVITRAIEVLAQLRTTQRDVRFSVNLGGSSFEDNALLDHIKDCLQRHQVPPYALTLEITEQIAVRYLERARDQVQSLLQLGCRLALDDFGAGFSSLSYLKILPVDFIKISQTFVQHLASDKVDQAMVRSIIQIAKSLRKQTIAEYVQDATTIELLCDYGVDYAQGNFIAAAGAQADAEIFERYTRKRVQRVGTARGLGAPPR